MDTFSIPQLQAAARERISHRDEFAAMLEGLRSRIEENEAQRDAADAAADAAQAKYIDALGDHAMGQKVDLVPLKRARDKATDELDALVDLDDALAAKVTQIEAALEESAQAAAAALEDVAVARAEQLREEYRHATAVWARYASRYFSMAKAAAEARRAATGIPGEPVPYTAPRYALLEGLGGIYDQGLGAVLNDHGISRDLTPIVGVLQAPTEAELVAESDDDDGRGSGVSATDRVERMEGLS